MNTTLVFGAAAAPVAPGHDKAEALFAANVRMLKVQSMRAAGVNQACWKLLGQNQALQARSACKKALDLQSTTFYAWVNLGHSYLLAGDTAQARHHYREALEFFAPEDPFNRAALDSLQLFVKKGWAAAEAASTERWFESHLFTIKSLRMEREQAEAMVQQGKTREGLARLLQLREQAQRALGEGSFTRSFLWRYLALANQSLDHMVAKNTAPSEWLAFVDDLVADGAERLPDQTRWSVLEHVQGLLERHDQQAATPSLRMRIYTEKLTKLGPLHPETLASAPKVFSPKLIEFMAKAPGHELALAPEQGPALTFGQLVQLPDQQREEAVALLAPPQRNAFGEWLLSGAMAEDKELDRQIAAIDNELVPLWYAKVLRNEKLSLENKRSLSKLVKNQEAGIAAGLNPATLEQAKKLLANPDAFETLPMTKIQAPQ